MLFQALNGTALADLDADNVGMICYWSVPKPGKLSDHFPIFRLNFNWLMFLKSVTLELPTFWF